MPAGRPTLFTEELANKICNDLAEGKSLRTICSDEKMPSRETVRLWLRDERHSEFLGQYARSREEQADHYADEIVEIADTEEDAQRARVRIDARKWVASKLKARSYGDKVLNEHTGKDGGPIKTEEVSQIAAEFRSRIVSLASRVGTDSGDKQSD